MAKPSEASSEILRIKGFRDKNSSRYLADRSQDDFFDAISDNYSFTCESPWPDNAPDPTGARIVAHGALFDRRGDGLRLEVGGNRVHPDWEGHRLQAWLVRAMILHLAEAETWSARDVLVFAKIHASNGKSRRNAIGVGFELKAPTPEIAGLYGLTVAEFISQGDLIYVLPRVRLDQIRRAMAEFVADGKRAWSLDRKSFVRVLFADPLNMFDDQSYYERYGLDRQVENRDADDAIMFGVADKWEGVR